MTSPAKARRCGDGELTRRRSDGEHVHADAAGFAYAVGKFSLGGGPATMELAAAAAAFTTEEANVAAAALDEGAAAPDFLSLDGDAAPGEAAGPPSGAEPSAAAGLLADYVSLGLLAAPRGAAADAAAAAAAAARARPPPLARVPWLPALRGISSPLLRLHQEIVELARYLAPSPGEAEARRAAVARVSAVVREIWPSARLEVFGSFATGLYLPSSDLDLVILDSGCTHVPSGLKALATALARRSMVKNMQVIAKARVPIIKFEDAESGYAFDVSFDVANGPEASDAVRALMDALPPMRPLVLLLKVFLQQRELNEVYSGGVGSYALLVMVAAFLQTHPSRRAARGAGGRAPKGGKRAAAAAAAAAPLEGNLGALLLDFLRLYGRALPPGAVGISCRRGGAFFDKRSRGFANAERPALFAVEDPNDPANDLGKNSWNAARVRMAFDHAYCALAAPAPPGESMLARVIRLDAVLFLRAPPAPLPPAGAAAPPAAAAAEEGEDGGEAAAAPSGKAKGKKKAKQEARRAERAREEADAKREARKRPRGEKAPPVGVKRKHRERSESDSDLG
jgi:non-canonical poly(A) RNA polymerase PAPD5/7